MVSSDTHYLSLIRIRSGLTCKPWFLIDRGAMCACVMPCPRSKPFVLTLRLGVPNRIELVLGQGLKSGSPGIQGSFVPYSCRNAIACQNTTVFFFLKGGSTRLQISPDQWTTPRMSDLRLHKVPMLSLAELVIRVGMDFLSRSNTARKIRRFKCNNY